LAIEIFWSPNLVTRNLKSGCQSCGNWFHFWLPHIMG
jgi:hypothetical protein